jgi:DNA-directed RNA polymerase subunit L
MDDNDETLYENNNVTGGKVSKKNTKTINNKHLQNYKVTQLEYDLNVKAFAAIKDKIKELLPDRKEYRIDFDLVDVNDSIANAIRRTILDELEIKALTFETNTVSTNVDFLILSELLDRIELIPIRQNIPDDTVLSLMIINNTKEDAILYSGSIKGGANYIPKKFRLAELKPGNYIKIPQIKIIKGYGRDHARHSLTCDYSFYNLDYMDVAFITNKGRRIKKYVAVDDVMNLIKKTYSKFTGTIDDVINSRILVIPNSAYTKIINEQEQNRINTFVYDFVLTNDKTSLSDDEYLQERSSLLYSSRKFRMKYFISDQINPHEFLLMVCNNLINRLESILSILKNDEIDTNNVLDVKTRPVNIRHENEKAIVDLWELCIYGETHTIGELIVKHIFEIDPEIPFVKKTMRHSRDDKIFIEIIHANPKKICIDAIKRCIEVFIAIKNGL